MVLDFSEKHQAVVVLDFLSEKLLVIVEVNCLEKLLEVALEVFDEEKLVL